MPSEAERADNRGDSSDEPLGPATPDDGTPLGDTPEAHDAINPHDLPIDHPGRAEAERLARGATGTTRGHEEGGAEDDGDRLDPS